MLKSMHIAVTRIVAVIAGIVLGIVLSVIPDLGTCVACTGADITAWEQRSLYTKALMGLALLLAAVVLRRTGRPGGAIGASAGGVTLIVLLLLGTLIRTAELSGA